MKIGTPLPRKKARIEIIPLIDIMFFLLVSFMLVSFSMIKMEAIKLDLPVVTKANRDSPINFLNIDVTKEGDPSVDKKVLSLSELRAVLSSNLLAHSNLQVYIRGHKEATHGSVIHVLDLIRAQGILKVSFAVTQEKEQP